MARLFDFDNGKPLFEVQKSEDGEYFVSWQEDLDYIFLYEEEIKKLVKAISKKKREEKK